MRYRRSTQEPTAATVAMAEMAVREEAVADRVGRPETVVEPEEAREAHPVVAVAAAAMVVAAARSAAVWMAAQTEAQRAAARLEEVEVEVEAGVARPPAMPAAAAARTHTARRHGGPPFCRWVLRPNSSLNSSALSIARFQQFEPTRLTCSLPFKGTRAFAMSAPFD